MKHVHLPMSEKEIRSLKAGETVLLSGTVYTARDAAHKRISEMIERGEKLPIDLKDAAIYYVGPTPAKPNQAIGSAGPTTSSRMDPYTPILIERGLQAMIGKGRRSDAVKAAMKGKPVVYFVTVGGAGALLSHTIRKREMIAFEDLLSEALTKLTIEEFPAFVGIDCAGNDIYDMENETI